MSAATASTKLRRSENKEAKGLAVSIAILEIIESEGLLGVTHSKVARKSKVSRAWIYQGFPEAKRLNSLTFLNWRGFRSIFFFPLARSTAFR